MQCGSANIESTFLTSVKDNRGDDSKPPCGTD